MWSVRRPSLDQIRRHREQQRDLAFTYEAVGATRHGTIPAGFDRDHNRQPLGTGAATFTAACDAIRAWAMFPAPLAQIVPAGIPIAQGEVAAVLAHALGFWWLNAARIVYVIDEPRRFGFAYGTLPRPCRARRGTLPGRMARR